MAFGDAAAALPKTNETERGTDMMSTSIPSADFSLAREMDALLEDVALVHRTTVLENNPIFLLPISETKKINKRHCSVPRRGDVDLSVTNCAEQVRGTVTDNAIRVLDYWTVEVIPKLTGAKIHRGKAASYLKAAVVGLARCCCFGGVPPKTAAEARFLEGVGEDHFLWDVVLNKTTATGATPVVHPHSAALASPELMEETLDALFHTIYKHWTAAHRAYSATHPNKPKKYDSVVHFVKVWKRIVQIYSETPEGDLRDLRMKNLMALGETEEGDGDFPVPATDMEPSPLYPLITPPLIIVSDYVFKLLVELVLSPHIHPEWKIAMCKFVDKDAGNMLFKSGIIRDVEAAAFAMNGMEEQGKMEFGEGVVDECRRRHGGKYNPVRLLPVASHFFDFCKGYHSPSAVRCCLLFNEPSVFADLSSGAGMFGRFVGDVKDRERREVRVVADCLSKLLSTPCSGEQPPPSTRNWREGGAVVCFNMCPVTVSGAVLGYGEARTRVTSLGFWIKTVQRAIVDSVKRKRVVADKGGRNSDLLSDEGGIRLATVAFGCVDMLSELTGMSTFNVLDSFATPIQAGAESSERHYSSSWTVSQCLPKL